MGFLNCASDLWGNKYKHVVSILDLSMSLEQRVFAVNAQGIVGCSRFIELCCTMFVFFYLQSWLIDN